MHNQGNTNFSLKPKSQFFIFSINYKLLVLINPLASKQQISTDPGEEFKGSQRRLFLGDFVIL